MALRTHSLGSSSTKICPKKNSKRPGLQNAIRKSKEDGEPKPRTTASASLNNPTRTRLAFPNRKSLIAIPLCVRRRPAKRRRPRPCSRLLTKRHAFLSELAVRLSLSGVRFSRLLFEGIGSASGPPVFRVSSAVFRISAASRSCPSRGAYKTVRWFWDGFRIFWGWVWDGFGMVLGWF